MCRARPLLTIGLWSDQRTVDEGWPDPLEFRLDRYGDATAPLDVRIWIDDPHRVLDGNHWVEPTERPGRVRFAAGSTSEMFFITVPDDSRVAPGEAFTVTVPHSRYYFLRGSGELGYELSKEITVFQNDTAQQLELHFGKQGVNGAGAIEGDTLKAVVKRRQQDAGANQIVPFVVRVETGQQEADPLLDDWTEDSSTGRLFKDFPMELTGADTEIEQVIEVARNGAAESTWSYWASIRPLENYKGNALTDAQEAEYWTVKEGYRETMINVTDTGGLTGTITLRTDQTEVYEGEEVVFALTRTGGPIALAATVKILTEEPRRRIISYNPSNQNHIVTFEAWEDTATLSVFAYVDEDAEVGADRGDPLIASTVSVVVGDYTLVSPTTATVEINDPPTGSALIELESDKTAMAEGETATFTLYRSRRVPRAGDHRRHPGGRSVRTAAASVSTTRWMSNCRSTFPSSDAPRTWASPRHSSCGWSTTGAGLRRAMPTGRFDPVTGFRYFEFPLTLTGNQRQVVGRLEMMDNGRQDLSLWEYTAEIKRLEEVADGVPLTTDEEAQYWTVNEPARSGYGNKKWTRRQSIVVEDRGPPSMGLRKVTEGPVQEGQEVTFKLGISGKYRPQVITAYVQTWEPNHRQADGYNPTKQLHTIIFPATPVADPNLFMTYTYSEKTFTVIATDDTVYEVSDSLRAKIVNTPYNYHSTWSASVGIADDDRPTISLSASSTSVTEGEPLTFTLTRAVNTTEELIVGVAVDDPGGFLQGNYSFDAVEVPSSVVFAPGEIAKVIDVTPPNDRRDIPDSTLTLTVAQETTFDIVGAYSLTVPVADNDVAPQVRISFNAPEVEEGNDLILSIERIGDDRNSLEIAMNIGPEDDQRYEVIGFGSGESGGQIHFRRPDDNYKSPDDHYEATALLESPEFWTIAGDATVSGSIVDNDPFRVGVRATYLQIDEGQLLYYQLFHDGHTGESLYVKVSHSEDGSAVNDGHLGPETHVMPAGPSTYTRAYPSDASDGDAEFIVEVLPSDDYEIDLAYASATIIVRDTEPLPVLDFLDSVETYGEGYGYASIPVTLTSPLPVPRTVTVDYEIIEEYETDGVDVTETSGTLEFPAGTTQANVRAQILQDLMGEEDEQFTVVLSNPVNATLQDGGTSLTYRGFIRDDEPTVSVEAAAASVDEGRDIVLTLTRTGDVAGELTAWLRVADSRDSANVTYPQRDLPRRDLRGQLRHRAAHH